MYFMRNLYNCTRTWESNNNAPESLHYISEWRARTSVEPPNLLFKLVYSTVATIYADSTCIMLVK